MFWQQAALCICVMQRYALRQANRHSLTFSQTMTPFDAPEKQAFRKHYG